MKMIIKKKSKRAAKFLFCASLCASFYPVEAKADMAEDIRAALIAAGGDAREVGQQMAVLVWSQAKDAARAVFSGGREWGAATFQEIVIIAGDYDLAIDALIPTVQGCIKNADGTALVDATVVGVGATPGLSGSLVPILARTSTSSDTLSATVWDLPVQKEWLSEEQQAKWDIGCYWMPIPPGLVDGVLSIVNQESTIQHKVIPMAIGYEMSPPGKLIKKIGKGGVRVFNLDNPMIANASDSSGSQTIPD